MSTTDTNYAKQDFTKNPLPQGEYDNCTFNACEFLEADLSGIRFVACEFRNCNLSLAKMEDTALLDVHYIGCKMLGIVFEQCSDFNFTPRFSNCVLNNSSFYKKKMKKSTFINNEMKEMDFTECDLSETVFNNCDLMGSTFLNTNLEKADFTTAVNYTISPQSNRVKKAKFKMSGLPGLLAEHDIKIYP